jgi:hypothetical protein
MNKLLALALAVLLVVPVLAHALVYVKPEDIRFRAGGVERFNEYFYDPRVQSKKTEITVYLTPPQQPVFARGYPHYFPRGTAKVHSVRTQYSPQARVNIQVKDVRTSSFDNTVYQAWLYDSDTGYSLSLGQFQAIEGNNAEMTASGSFYIDAYDYVLVTRELKDDIDPRPSNDEVLVGKIVQKQLYEPTPQLGEKAQYGYSYYGN